MLCTLPPLMSYSLALSSTMMSCTVHSPTDSLAQPTCILVYIECNPAPGGSPFELSFGLCSNSRVLFLPLSSESHVWWFVLGSPLGCLRHSSKRQKLLDEVDHLLAARPSESKLSPSSGVETAFPVPQFKELPEAFSADPEDMLSSHDGEVPCSTTVERVHTSCLNT